jgi:hypothetical protein
VAQIDKAIDQILHKEAIWLARAQADFPPVLTRADAEALLILDHGRTKLDRDWTAYLVDELVNFLVWRNRPAGEISESDLDWVLALLADAPSLSAPALLFALAREVPHAPDRLMALALRHAKNRLCGVASAPRLAF